MDEAAISSAFGRGIEDSEIEQIIDVRVVGKQDELLPLSWSVISVKSTQISIQIHFDYSFEVS